MHQFRAFSAIHQHHQAAAAAAAAANFAAAAAVNGTSVYKGFLNGSGGGGNNDTEQLKIGQNNEAGMPETAVTFIFPVTRGPETEIRVFFTSAKFRQTAIP